MNRMARRPAAALPFAALPTDTFFNDRKDLLFNGEGIQILHLPNAHTDGDTHRLLPPLRRDQHRRPVHHHRLSGHRSASAAGRSRASLPALNRIIDLAIPSNVMEGGTMIVPGHGRVGDEMDVVEYRDMVTIVRDRIQNMIDKGMTLEQVKAARPTFDFDPRYGSDTGPGRRRCSSRRCTAISSAARRPVGSR